MNMGIKLYSFLPILSMGVVYIRNAISGDRGNVLGSTGDKGTIYRKTPRKYRGQRPIDNDAASEVPGTKALQPYSNLGSTGDKGHTGVQQTSEVPGTKATVT
jgi:hypothetical protein